MIVLLHAPAPEFVREASKRGVFAYITDADAEDWQSSIDIVLRRFAEYHDLEGAFGRRAVTERAKGILMERHSVDESNAFAMLRDHSRDRNRKLIDVGTRRGRRPPVAAQATGFLNRPGNATQCNAERATRTPATREQQHTNSRVRHADRAGLLPLARILGPVGDQHHRCVALAEPVGHELRQDRQPRTPGHDHEHARGRRDSAVDHLCRRQLAA